MVALSAPRKWHCASPPRRGTATPMSPPHNGTVRTVSSPPSRHRHPNVPAHVTLSSHRSRPRDPGTPRAPLPPPRCLSAIATPSAPPDLLPPLPPLCRFWPLLLLALIGPRRARGRRGRSSRKGGPMRARGGGAERGGPMRERGWRGRSNESGGPMRARGRRERRRGGGKVTWRWWGRGSGRGDMGTIWGHYGVVGYGDDMGS